MGKTKEKAPADLGLKVATNKEEAKWVEIQDRATATILTAKLEIEINEEIVKLAKRKIERIQTNPSYCD